VETFRTPVTDILDAHGIAYRLLPHSEPVFTVAAAARQRGVIEQEMVKSILLRDKEGHYVMACVRGVDRVDPRAVQANLRPGWSRLYFASREEILAVTGCVQGAVSPLGLPESLPVLFDTTLASLPRVNISSGDPMAGLELDPKDLIRVTRARLAPIAERERASPPE
jgi:prolyl-tRNA editing enzyme YbaK/EbsC (Cys-tRNA(Pro) deacylase)